MDEYKKIIGKQETRINILRLLSWVPDAVMLKVQYWVKFRRKLNLKSPKRFTEKIQWYKLYYKNENMPVCTDKYTVRDYVASKGLESILIPIYGVYQNVDDIQYDTLPHKFIMKLSNGSGTNVICRDKEHLDINMVKEKFKYYKKKIMTNSGREWPYTKSESVIIVEKLLEDHTHINNVVNDYKIFCYNGKPEYIICISDRYSDRCNHIIYDVDWNKIPVVSEEARLEENISKPENLKEMLDVARILSEEFPFARVDLYSLKGKIYFGEITFYPWSGYMEFKPDEFDYVLGKKFDIGKLNV